MVYRWLKLRREVGDGDDDHACEWKQNALCFNASTLPSSASSVSHSLHIPPFLQSVTLRRCIRKSGSSSWRSWMRRRRSPNQVSVRAFYEPRWAPAHSRDTTLQPDRPARGAGWLGELRASWGFSTSLGCKVGENLCLRCWLFLVSISVAWEVVGLVSSSRTYPLLVGWLVSRLVSRLVTWLLGEK